MSEDQIDAETIQTIAHLARLAIDENDVSGYATNLSNILNLVASMQAVDTDDVVPMSHPLHMTQRLRADVVAQTKTSDKVPVAPEPVIDPQDRECLLQNAPQAEDGYFLVPKVID